MSHVVVIGAGPNGLTAAATLRKAGHEVTLVDARGEPGERAAAARRLEFGPEIRAERWFVVCGLEVCD